jgi:hypothetical protein
MKPLVFVVLLIGAVVALSCEDQQVTAPEPTAISLHKTPPVPANACVADRDRDRDDAPVQILCAITVPDNPITNVAKGWFSNVHNAVYIADQSNKGVDVIDLRRYEYLGRVTGFVGVATAGGGTATTNGQGPNSMVLTGPRHMWVSDGNSQVQVVNLFHDDRRDRQHGDRGVRRRDRDDALLRPRQRDDLRSAASHHHRRESEPARCRRAAHGASTVRNAH